MRWIVEQRRRLARLLGYAPAVVFKFMPVVEPRAWTPQNQKDLVGFLNTPAGSTLMVRMAAAAAANAMTGCEDTMSTSHSAGRSAGFYDAIRWLHSQAHLEFAQEIPISGASADQDAEFADQLGEAELRDRYSP